MYHSSFFEPFFYIVFGDLFHGSIANLCCFEASLCFESCFFKSLSTPKKQSYRVFEFVIAYDRISIEKPDRVCMPYLALRFGKLGAYFVHQYFADFLVFGKLFFVICDDFLVHRREVINIFVSYLEVILQSKVLVFSYQYQQVSLFGNKNHHSFYIFLYLWVYLHIEKIKS